MSIENFATLVETEQMLRQKGFTVNFRHADGVLIDTESKKSYTQNQLTIIARRRFEGATNPGDMSILFAIQAEDGIKGQLASAYGTYADRALLQFMDEVKIADHTAIAEP